MTTDEALELLRGGPEGVKKWNQWREENPGAVIPKFESVHLSYAHLEGAKPTSANG